MFSNDWAQRLPDLVATQLSFMRYNIVDKSKFKVVFRLVQWQFLE